MTEQTACPNCSHPPHLPGTECETHVHHGPSRFHLCLCLARPGAANACPPQMTCQGGTLGYADIWYLQQGHSLSSEDGVISPEVLTTGPASVGFPSQAPAVPAGQAPATDQTALRDRIGAEMARADGWDWAGAVFSTLDTPGANRYRKLADAVLAVLPASVDRAAVLRDFLWRLEQSAGDAAAEKFLDDNPELRRMADETPTAAASAVVVRRATDETPGEAQLPFIHVDDDGDQLDIGAVMASTYDGEAPVVYVAAEQHQGDTLATVYVRPERVDAVIAALRSARLAAETLPAADQQQPKEA